MRVCLAGIQVAIINECESAGRLDRTMRYRQGKRSTTPAPAESEEIFEIRRQARKKSDAKSGNRAADKQHRKITQL